jgi:Cu(I)/Ag(I) efflux system membrane protein CusA/SilA
MTVATTVLGLLPLLWEAGVGADVSARTAAPVVGGLWSCMLLTLLVLPAAYAMWRRHQVRAGMAPSPLAPADPAAPPTAAPLAPVAAPGAV